MVEWNYSTQLGERTFKITFTNGTRNNIASMPATYSTKNEIIQYAIEQSEQFQSGRIRIIKEVELDDENNVVVEDSDEGIGMPVASEAEDNNVMTVKVADKTEAIEYLKENYDSTLTATKLRSNDKFDAVCKEHGVKFEYSE